jgi:hypothetical protein
MICATCGADPCANPSFCRTCRKADIGARKHRKHDHDLDRLQRLLEPNVSFERAQFQMQRDHFAGRAAEATVEALMFSLRERGLRALEESSTQRRLSELSDDQVIQVERRLQKLNLGLGAWTAAEVEILVRLREELRA